MGIHGIKNHMTVAYRYSSVRLSLNYYTYYETITEAEFVPAKLKELSGTFHKLLASFLRGEDTERELLELRNQVIHQVGLLTSYTDCFQIYEYVLNRLERKVGTMPETGYGDDEFCRLVMQYITGAEDSAVMNGRIKQVISQLPVRLTKQKFDSLIRDGLSVYLGSSRKSLDDMMYMLRSESAVSPPDGLKDGREDLFEILGRLEHMDYKNIDKDAYLEASAWISFAGKRLSEESGIYVMLQDLINDLYVLVLSCGEAIKDWKEQQVCTEIIREVLNKFISGDTSMIDQNVTMLLVLLEGKQEAYYERYLGLAWTEQEKNAISDCRIAKVRLLLSGSSFAELTEPEEPDLLVDTEYLEQTVSGFCQELQLLFSRCPRQVSRSVMAKVLSCLPVFFNSVEEIQNYIYGSVKSCTDPAELETCKELLTELMET